MLYFFYCFEKQRCHFHTWGLDNKDLMNDFQRKQEGTPEKDSEVKKVKHDDAQKTNGDTNGHN